MLVFDEKAKTEQTIPQSAVRLTAPFAQGSHMVWRLLIDATFHKGVVTGRAHPIPALHQRGAFLSPPFQSTCSQKKMILERLK